MPEHWALVPPGDFADLDWFHAGAKGVLRAAHLAFGGRRFPVTLYDPVRIVQDADPAPFYEPNVVLLPEVTREAADEEIARLGAEGRLDWLLSLAPAPESEWSLSGGLLRHGDRPFPATVLSQEELALAVGSRPVRFYAENLIVAADPPDAIAALSDGGSFGWLLGEQR